MNNIGYHPERNSGHLLSVNPPQNQEVIDLEKILTCPNCGGDPIKMNGHEKHCPYCDFYW